MFAYASRKPDAPTVEQSEGDFSLDDRIARVLSEDLFPSVRQIDKKVVMSKSPLDRHLWQGMPWKLRHLKCVPYTPTEFEK
jgi:hypothetical protein